MAMWHIQIALAVVLGAPAAAERHTPSVTQRCYALDGAVVTHCDRYVYTIHAASGSRHHGSITDCLRNTLMPSGITVNSATHVTAEADGAFALPLRKGVNTVSVSIPRALTTCTMAPQIDVDGTLPLPRVGAQLPYVEVEAENASTTTGTIIGPDYRYHYLPSEASFRMAVSLAPGQYIEWTIPEGAQANAISMRYSIPDSAQGGGIDTPALLMINGQMVANLTLTSVYSWYYGSYPFTKRPSDGGAHHFYDQIALWLPQTYPAGTKVRLHNPSAGRPVRSSLSSEWWNRDRALSLAANCSYNPPDPQKHDCGFNGINETQCEQRNCCWFPINPNPNNYPWCYTPATPPTPTPPPPEPGNVTITVDLIDFFDVGPADPQPGGSLSIIDYGADPTGAKDSSAAVTAAIAAAASKGNSVWVPSGNYTITQHIQLTDNLVLTGAGPWYSVLRGLGVGLYGGPYGGTPNKNVHVAGLSIVGDTRIRDDSQADTGIGGALTDSVASNLFITHTKCGMWLDGPFDNFLITGVWIHDTTADGVNFHRGITNSVVEHSCLRNTGDDGLAMWSDQQADVNNTFQFNTVQVPILANNLAIYGGSGNSMRSNFAADTLTEGGGLHVGNRFSAVSLAGVTTLDSNEVHRGGQLDPNWNFGVGAAWFYALDSAMNGDIVVSNNVIVDSPWEAFQVIGSSVNNLAISNATVINVGSFVFQFQCGGTGSAQGVVATGSQYFGQYNCGVQFTLKDMGGNSGWNTTHCGWPPS